MKILYSIQGTGNGHLSRAYDIVPLLKEKAQVDVLISGCQVDVEFPFQVDYRLGGLSFIFGKKGGIDYWNTYYRNKTRRFYHEVKQLPVEKYDLVINDFEPVSAWACRNKGVPCIGLSHQSAVLAEEAPQPDEKDRLGKVILKRYAPVDSSYGFHFKSFSDRIYTPVIRKQVRELETSNDGHYTVYLPAYSDERIIKKLSQIKGVEWQVFTKHNKNTYRVGNLFFQPVNNQKFLKSLASAEGVLCGAGFETPAEVLFLQKKLMVIPMKGQYEQQCNAAALKSMGVPVIKSLKNKHIDKLTDWILFDQTIETAFPDITSDILDRVISENIGKD